MQRPGPLVGAAAALTYLAIVGFTGWLAPYRFPTPYAVPIFDTPFVLVAIGVGILCLERHRVRQDFVSAALANSLLLAAMLAGAHILVQPDYPAGPRVDAGIAPYLFLLSYLAALVGVGLASRYARRPAVLSEGARIWIGLAVITLGGALIATVLVVRPLLPSLVIEAGRFTPFGIYVAAAVDGVAGLWALGSARKRWHERAANDHFSGTLVAAAGIWAVGLAGFILHPFRYGVAWYLAGFARPLAVGVIFVGLIREQVWLYREARAREHELERLVAQLEQTQAQLIQAGKLQALGTMLSGMAHELNNPLSTILLSAQLLQRRGELPETVLQRLRIMEVETQRAAGIIKDLLVFSRQHESARKSVDLAEVIKAAVGLQRPQCDFNNVQVLVDIDLDLPAIAGDPNHLQQVLLNVMSNAVHAMRAANGRGTLYIRLFRSGEELSIQVDDDGPGIPAAYLGRIFDPFFTTKKVGEGTGLGLSLSHGIVESHGGRMRAENLPGAGARFTIVLPITEVRASEPRTEASVTPSGAARILVVDDEAGLGTVLSDTLRGLGHDVEVAASGQDARQRLERTNYDVIALDLRLPDVSGREIWRWIVSNKSILSSRVVFMTGDILSPETTAFLEGAGRPVLTKPIALRPLARAIEDIRAGDGARPATRSDARSAATIATSLSPTDAER